MIKLKMLALFALVSAACNDAPTSATGPAANGAGLVDVSVRVSGDTTLSPPKFAIALNGKAWTELSRNETYRATLAEGYYRINLSPLGGSLSPSWCLVGGPFEQTVRIKAGLPQTIAFSLVCPPLIGSGHLVITASGLASRQTIPVAVVRVMPGPPFSIAAAVPIGRSLEIDVPVGVHAVTAALPGNCRLAGAYGLLGVPLLLVRDGDTVTFNIQLSCHGWPPGIP